MISASRFLSLPVNQRGRDFVIGDLHGEFDLLQQAMLAVSFDESSDRLFSVGDLIDRGPRSAEALDFVLGASWFHSVRGNHEQLMIDACRSQDEVRIWRMNGGGWAANLLSVRLGELVSAVSAFPLAIEFSLVDGRRIGIVHAELPAMLSWSAFRDLMTLDHGIDDAHRHEASLLWGRSRATRAMKRSRGGQQSDLIFGIDLLLSGHTVTNLHHPLRLGNQIFLDTGACFPNGGLTILEPASGRSWRIGRGKSHPLRHGTVTVSPCP